MAPVARSANLSPASSSLPLLPEDAVEFGQDNSLGSGQVRSTLVAPAPIHPASENHDVEVASSAMTQGEKAAEDTAAIYAEIHIDAQGNLGAVTGSALAWRKTPPAGVAGQSLGQVAPLWLRAAVRLKGSLAALTEGGCEIFVPEWDRWAYLTGQPDGQAVAQALPSNHALPSPQALPSHVDLPSSVPMSLPGNTNPGVVLRVQAAAIGGAPADRSSPQIIALARAVAEALLPERPIEQTLAQVAEQLHLGWGTHVVAIWHGNSPNPDQWQLAAWAGCRFVPAQPTTIERLPVGVCFVIEGRLIGMLALWEDPSRPVDRDELQTMAHWLTIALDRSLSKLALASRRESLLLDLVEKLHDATSIELVLPIALGELRSMLGLDRCLYLWSWPEAALAGAEAPLPEGAGGSWLGELPEPAAHWLAETLHQGREWVVERAVERSDPAPFSATAWAIVPVSRRLAGAGLGGALDAIACVMEHQPRAWGEEELSLVRGVATQVALALDRAALIDQSRAAALAAQAQAQQLERAMTELKQTQARLVQSEKMSALGQVVAGIAHEINNPTNFISGNLVYVREYISVVMELLVAYQQTPAAELPNIRALSDQVELDYILEDWPRLLSSMDEGTRRIQAIITSLKQFSQLDRAEVQCVDLRESLENTLLVLQSRLARRESNSEEIRLERFYAPDVPLIECYAGQVNQVLLGLLSNAIDALEERSTDARIRLRLVPCWLHRAAGQPKPSGRGLLVQISDNGMGMDRAILDHAFDPFFTTKPVGRGTGLGLSIAYQLLVQKHNGRLICQSRRGKGTRLTFVLPLQLSQRPTVLGHEGPLA